MLVLALTLDALIVATAMLSPYYIGRVFCKKIVDEQCGLVISCAALLPGQVWRWGRGWPRVTGNYGRRAMLSP